MFGTGEGVLRVVCVTGLLLVGALGGVWRADANSLSSPCNGDVLSLDTGSSLPLLPVYTISSIQLDKQVDNVGCFARWLPLNADVLLERDLFEIKADLSPSFEIKILEPLASGLFSELQTAWDQENFQVKRESLSSVGFSFGNVARLEAEREAILSFLEQVANNLLPSSQAGGDPVQAMGFTFNLNNIRLNPQTLVGSSGVFSVDENLNLFLEDLTITVSNGTITGETQFNPESLSFDRGAFSINLNIGNALVTSTTTFEKDQGVTKQVLNLSAGLGRLQLHSQVTLALDRSEFRLGATISDLDIWTTSVIDVYGNSTQTFELEFDF